MSPDQVTRAAPGQSSNVSPGDSIGRTAYWWKEIMYHRQRKTQLVKTQPVSSQSLQSLSWSLPCHVERQREALSTEGDGVSAASRHWRNNIMHSIHTQRMWKRNYIYYQKDTNHRREIRRLTHGKKKKKKLLAVFCVLEDGWELTPGPSSFHQGPVVLDRIRAHRP